MRRRNVTEPGKHLLEIGIVSAGRLSTEYTADIRNSGMLTRNFLAEQHPCYHWKMSFVSRPDLGEFTREESSHLLLQAADERDAHNWDFVFLVTDDDLIPHYSSFALAALSRPLDAALISTSRLNSVGDPGTTQTKNLQIDRRNHVSRLHILMLHAIGHWAGLPSTDSSTSIMFRPSEVVLLDTMTQFSVAEQKKMDRSFQEIADTRLEESYSDQYNRLHFWLKALWINRHEIVEAVVAARPWDFPRRLGKLTTAAVSTVAILLLTAEAWDLALIQSPIDLTLLLMVSLLATTVFVATRFQLLLRRRKKQTEQQVVTQVSSLLVVTVGLLTTWSCLSVLGWCVSSALYSKDLILTWAGSQTELNDSLFNMRLRMAVFCGSIGLLIGSLGASFEEQHHFRHVIFVDEEI